MDKDITEYCTEVWKKDEYSLRYCLGEFTLFRAKFPALMNTTHFLDKRPIDSSSVPQELLQSKAGVAVDQSRPTASSLPRLSVVQGYIRYVTWHYDRQFVNLEGDFSTYENSFRSKTRSTLRRKVKKLLNGKDINEILRVYTAPDEIIEFWNKARIVSAKSYQERLLEQGLPNSESYLQELIESSKNGKVIGWILYYNNEPIAYTLGEVVSDQAILYGHTGYDPELSKLSPGTVLQYLIIRYLFDEKEYEVYDLCIGQAEHKRLFANADQLCADIIYMKVNIRKSCVVITHVTFSMINESLIWIMKKLGIKNIVKKLIRRFA